MLNFPLQSTGQLRGLAASESRPASGKTLPHFAAQGLALLTGLHWSVANQSFHEGTDLIAACNITILQ